jgi:hypothetical protein
MCDEAIPMLAIYWVDITVYKCETENNQINANLPRSFHSAFEHRDKAKQLHKNVH